VLDQEDRIVVFVLILGADTAVIGCKKKKKKQEIARNGRGRRFESRTDVYNVEFQCLNLA